MAALIVLIVIAVVVLFTLSRGIRIVPQARAGIVERLGRYQRTLDAGLALVVPYIDRVKPLLDLREQVVSFPPQPVITEDNLPCSDRLGHLLPGHRPEGRHLRDRRLHRGHRAAHGDHAAQRDRRHDARGHAHLARQDQHGAAVVLDEATGKWGIRVNRVELKAIDPPGSIQEAMEKQMRAERDRRAAILTAEGVKQSQILTAEGEKQSAILRAEGQPQSQILRGRGPVEGDRDGLRRDPPRRRRPEAARLPVPPDAAADRPGRVEQGLDHPERVHAGARHPARR